MLVVLNFSNLLDCVLRAAFTINFFTFARKSNIVPSSHQKFDAKKNLTRGDILITPVGLLVSMHWSKTNQFKKKVVHIPLAPVKGSVLCPVNAYFSCPVKAFSAGIPSELIKEHGDWLSQAYLCYLNFNLEERLSVTRGMGNAISKLGI